MRKALNNIFIVQLTIHLSHALDWTTTRRIICTRDRLIDVIEFILILFFFLDAAKVRSFFKPPNKFEKKNANKFIIVRNKLSNILFYHLKPQKTMKEKDLIIRREAMQVNKKLCYSIISVLSKVYQFEKKALLWNYEQLRASYFAF